MSALREESRRHTFIGTATHESIAGQAITIASAATDGRQDYAPVVGEVT